MKTIQNQAEKRELLSLILKTGVKVAKHERGGPANYIKIHPSIDLSEYLKLAGLRIDEDRTLVDSFIIGRDHDKFEIEQEF